MKAIWARPARSGASGGFTFEYSATFNQIVGNDDSLRDAYGKCLLFDYPYRAFHADGYGKDYAISNLPRGAEDENSDMYLLGFYRQCRIWRDGHVGWTAFNVTRPLWVFLGKTVTGGSKTRADQATRSDVVRILDFLGWVLARGDTVRPMIGRLLAGESGLTDDAGGDYFAGRFDDLKHDGENAIYDDICKTLFHGPGRLHAACLTAGEDEMHLRTADNAPFGVINVGDSAALYKILNENANPDFDVEREAGFTRRLFADVDRADSTVNIVIGARRFIAGWNSWRVSTMGLMHVGVGERPEIIQMFGRGVRLKGWNMSLKRHRQSGAEAPVDGGRLVELETLRIFGLRANYMQTFRNLLAKEGMRVEQATVPLPVTWNFAKRDLKIIRIKQGLRYERSADRPVLPDLDGSGLPIVEMDLYSQLQAVESGHEVAGHVADRPSVKLEAHHIALFDRGRIYDKLLTRKRRMGWHNLALKRKTVDGLLDRHDWYTLHLPPERLAAASYSDIRRLENIAAELIAEYVSRYWRSQRRRWEAANIEVRTLDESDPNNIGKYELSVDADRTQLVQDIHALSTNLREGLVHHMKLGVIMADAHAYKPLLYATEKGEITVQPVPLNNSEQRVVESLAALATSGAPFLRGHELFLIRNRTRGGGVSFFDDHAYYPDFIVWLTAGAGQHVTFLDPKGLVRFGPDERKKVRLHTKIADIEKQIRGRDPDLRLHAYVLSVTSPDKIGDEPHTQEEWEKRGVYFLKYPDWPQRMLVNVPGAVPAWQAC